MQFFTRTTHLMAALSIVGATANQACFASRGDLISHTVSQTSTSTASQPVASRTVTHTNVQTYRIVGWQNQLTEANPNLGNFYWEPQWKRVVNTTKTTSKGATAAPPIVPNQAARYVRPIHAAAPVAVENAYQYPASGSGDGRIQTDVNARLRCVPGSSSRPGSSPVLTYHNAMHKLPELATAPSICTKESVYGVVKSGASIMR
jgi:hypothetical protein